MGNAYVFIGAEENDWTHPDIRLARRTSTFNPDKGAIDSPPEVEDGQIPESGALLDIDKEVGLSESRWS